MYAPRMKPLQTLTATLIAILALGTFLPSCSDSDLQSDCSGVCGCPVDATLTFTATVQDKATGMPLSNIELFCFGEKTPVATSDAMGALNFSIQTQEIPGCGYSRCTNLRLHDPSGAKLDVEGTYYTFNDTIVKM